MYAFFGVFCLEYVSLSTTIPKRKRRKRKNKHVNKNESITKAKTTTTPKRAPGAAQLYEAVLQHWQAALGQCREMTTSGSPKGNRTRFRSNERWTCVMAFDCALPLMSMHWFVLSLCFKFVALNSPASFFLLLQLLLNVLYTLTVYIRIFHRIFSLVSISLHVSLPCTCKRISCEFSFSCVSKTVSMRLV